MYFVDKEMIKLIQATWFELCLYMTATVLFIHNKVELF